MGSGGANADDDISRFLDVGDTNVIPESWNIFATLAGGKSGGSRFVFI